MADAAEPKAMAGVAGLVAVVGAGVPPDVSAAAGVAPVAPGVAGVALMAGVRDFPSAGRCHGRGGCRVAHIENEGL